MPCKFSKIFIDIYSTIDVKQPRLGFKARYFKRSNILLQVYSGLEIVTGTTVLCMHRQNSRSTGGATGAGPSKVYLSVESL